MARAVADPAVVVALRPAWKLGVAKTALTPPPPAPPFAPSFQTDSAEIAPPDASRLVPPQARTWGLEAGKSTWSAPSVTPSLEPLSPLATVTVTPITAAAWNAEPYELRDWAVHDDSGPPQLIEITEGLLTVSWAAVVMASRKPASVFGAK